MSIKVNQITKTYTNATNYSLDEISFEINKGEIFGLIGHNGSGKSTILKMLAGMLTPTTGSIYMNEVDIAKDKKYVREHAGVLFEPDRAMYWRLTGEENLLRIAQLKGMPRKVAIEEIHQYMKLLAIYDDKDKLVLTYSKGMKVKLAVISAFLGEPDILLLDEPFAGIDYKVRESIIKLIINFAQKGHIVVLCENNLDIMGQLCDHVILIEKGKKIAQSSPSELINEIQGEGIIEIKAENVDEVYDYLNHNHSDIYITMVKDEEGIQLLSNDILATLGTLKLCPMKFSSLSFREKNLSDYFIQNTYKN